MDTDSTTTGNGIPPLMKRPSAHHAHHTAAVVGAHAEEIQQQQRVTTQPPRPVTSSIPNFIDEGDNDEDLGLDVQYVNESRATAVSATRRTWSSTSFKSNQVCGLWNEFQVSDLIGNLHSKVALLQRFVLDASICLRIYIFV